MFPLKNTEAYIHANGFRSTLGKELADRDAEISELGSEIQALTNYVTKNNVKNFCPYTGTFTGKTTATSGNDNSFGTLALKTGDKIVFTCNQDSALTSNTRNTLIIIPPNATGPSDWIFESASAGSSANYHLDAGLHKIEYTATADGTYNFCLWTHTLSSAITYSQFMICYADMYDADPTYQPYAKTNVELTQAVTPKTGTFTYLGATFNYRVYPDRFVVWSNGSTTERLTASDWTAMLSTSPDLAGLYPDNVHGTLILSNGDILKLRLTTGGTVSYFRVSTGAGSGTYIQSSVVMYA